MQKERRISRTVLARGILLAALALVVYGIAPRISGLHQSWRVVLDADKPPLVIAVLLLAGTFVVAAVIYQLLAMHRLRFRDTFLVQLACGIAGKLLPAGLGSLGLNATYLRKHRHRLPEALAVVSVNNILGFLSYLLVLALAIFLLHDQVPRLHLAPHTLELLAGVALASVLVGVLLFKKRLFGAARATLRSLRLYRRQPGRLVAATLWAALLPCLFTAILFCCARALHDPISVGAAFAAFSASQIIGSATPTPGGIVGAEAGITGALVAYGLTADQALLVALLYRFITYWVAMLPGGLALLGIRKRLLR